MKRANVCILNMFEYSVHIVNDFGPGPGRGEGRGTLDQTGEPPLPFPAPARTRLGTPPDLMDEIGDIDRAGKDPHILLAESVHLLLTIASSLCVSKTVIRTKLFEVSSVADPGFGQGGGPRIFFRDFADIAKRSRAKKQTI